MSANDASWLTNVFKWLGHLVYSLTPPTLSNGDTSPLQGDANGNLRVVDVKAQPSRNGITITPDNSNDIAGGPIRALWVGGAGDVVLIMADDGTTSVTLKNVPAGTLIPGLVVKRIKATSTTATLMVGFP